MSICAHCSRETEQGARFCIYCGSEVNGDSQDRQVSALMCTRCGKGLTPGDRFCSYCGSDSILQTRPIAGASPSGSSSSGGSLTVAASAPVEQTQTQTTGFWSWERRQTGKGKLWGIILMVIAVVWFFGALALGWIFYYPPILFLIGLYTFFKGLFRG